MATPALSAPLLVVLAASLIAAMTDIWKFRVYNALTLPLLASGLVYQGWHGAFADSLLGAAIGFGALIILHVMGGMGAGDVKLMAGVGAWLGSEYTLYVFFASSLAAGAYALALVVLNGRLYETLVNLQILVHRLATIGRLLGPDDRVEREVRLPGRRGRIIPFGAMVAVGVAATLLYLWANK